jgi:hypothetical protein
MDAAYRRHLSASGARWVELRGPIDARLTEACAAIDELLAEAAA